MLAVDVWPALLTQIGALVGSQPTVAMAAAGMPRVALKGLSEGEQDSVPESPWAWLMNSTGSLKNKHGSDQAFSDWQFNLRILADWTNDPVNAERILMPLLEQIRQVFQRAMKLGTSTVTFSGAVAVDWGYLPVNSIWYRTCDIQIEVSEKEIRNVQA